MILFNLQKCIEKKKGLLLIIDVTKSVNTSEPMWYSEI